MKRAHSITSEGGRAAYITGTHQQVGEAFAGERGPREATLTHVSSTVPLRKETCTDEEERLHFVLPLPKPQL